jgi:AcrR family transcriptional regulator
LRRIDLRGPLSVFAVLVGEPNPLALEVRLSLFPMADDELTSRGTRTLDLRLPSESMVSGRAEKARETRERVIKAARLLFAEQGFFSTTTTDVVHAARLPSRGSLYQHFANRELLFVAVLERVEEDLSERVAKTIDSPTGLGRLEQALASFLDASLEREVRQILLIDGPAVLGWQAWRDIEARYGLGALQQLLELGIEEGSIVVEDPAAMAHLLLSVVDEAALFIANSKSPKQARKTAGASVSTLLSGLRA